MCAKVTRAVGFPSQIDKVLVAVELCFALHRPGKRVSQVSYSSSLNVKQTRMVTALK